MKNNDFDTREQNTYQTGSTTPPKGQSGFMAILLVLVIILAGLVSILSLLNIKLFSTVYQNQTQQVPLSLEIPHYPKGNSIDAEADLITAEGNKTIGIVGDAVTPVYQRHFQLPEGLFITYVQEGSTASTEGIREGDVLISVDDIPISDQKNLLVFLQMHNIGDQFTADLYRRDTDQFLSVTLTIEESKP